ncbi:MAG TPA: DUF2875 family protein [Burkholderiaceae bacterium]
MNDLKPLNFEEATVQLTNLLASIFVLIALLLGASLVASARAGEFGVDSNAKEKVEKIVKPTTYTLEVIGLGVTFDKYRQTALWDILQKGYPYSTIREQDPNKYPWTGTDKSGVGGGRACDALENGANLAPMYWGTPTLFAGPPIPAKYHQPSAIEPMAGLVSSADITGMSWHLFVTGPWKLAETPDRLLIDVFDFFDAHPEVPYVVVSSYDSSGARDRFSHYEEPRRLRTGYYIPERPDATALFILARRERVEPLRAFVWDDPDNDFGQEKTRRMYIGLENSVPSAEKMRDPKYTHGRQPTVAEWLTAAAEFAQRSDVRSRGLGQLLGGPGHPPRNWKPTPWFPVPWSKQQMAAFDHLPTLGFLHRPVFVKLTGEQNQPVSRDERKQLLFKGWQEALLTLSEDERKRGPARIIAAFGNDVEHHLALEAALRDYAAQGGPEIDSGKTAQFINTDRRLENTGAATWFMQMAIGVMGSYKAGGVSAAVNLRDKDEASIVFISPPPADVIERQAGRGDVFRHRVGPAIDPANYKEPALQGSAAVH